MSKKKNTENIIKKLNFIFISYSNKMCQSIWNILVFTNILKCYVNFLSLNIVPLKVCPWMSLKYITSSLPLCARRVYSWWCVNTKTLILFIRENENSHAVAPNENMALEKNEKSKRICTFYETYTSHHIHFKL